MDERPRIEIGSDLHRVVDEAIAELPRGSRPLPARRLARAHGARRRPDPKRERAQMAVGTPRLGESQIASAPRTT